MNKIIQNLKATNELLFFICNKNNISLGTLLNDNGACIQDIIDDNNILISSGGWIDIKDGGFDDGQEILITDGKEVWTDTVMFDCSDNDYYIYFDGGSNPETVTHWQPKPEPPKERMNDNH
ncbi:DUF551 domain-containing protein [Moraxella bovis]|nr:DUF551 domain-containing protein [Moraxella bovis]OOR90793.1 hypothetical protein B0182_04555 [Moraxella bovis]UZA17752.1 DUF551 domain-containing protein [Moraxella bovis]